MNVALSLYQHMVTMGANHGVRATGYFIAPLSSRTPVTETPMRGTVTVAHTLYRNSYERNCYSLSVTDLLMRGSVTPELEVRYRGAAYPHGTVTKCYKALHNTS